MPRPKYFVDKRVSAIVNERGQSTQRFARLIELMSQSLWDKDYPLVTTAGDPLEITCSPAIVSLAYGVLTPYQVDSEVWKIDGNFSFAVAGGVRTGVTVTLPVTFKDGAGIFQPVTGWQFDGAFPVDFCHAEQDTGNIILQHTSGSTETYGFNLKGIELKSKPDFAEEPGVI